MEAVSQSRTNMLSACLLEAVADENLSNVQVLLQTYHAPAFHCVPARGIAAIHFAAGMEEANFGRRCIELMLEESAEAATAETLATSIDAPTADGETALQVATVWGHTAIAWLLLLHGASVELRDGDGLSAMDYAVREGHYDIVKLFREHVYAQKQKKATVQPIIAAAAVAGNNNGLAVPAMTSQHMLTPQRIPYNTDRTSPYFINITHRDRSRMQRLGQPIHRQSSGESPPASPATMKYTTGTTVEMPARYRVPTRVNLFQLTRDNVRDLAVATGGANAVASQKAATVERWRRKVAPIMQSIDNDSQHSLLPDDMEEFCELLQQNGAGVACSTLCDSPEEEEDEVVEVDDDVMEDAGDDAPVAVARGDLLTVDDAAAMSESNFIRSPSRERHTEFVYQVTEKFQHVDAKRGLALYELKLTPDIRLTDRLLPEGAKNAAADDDNAAAGDNLADSYASTGFTVPLDYDTDVLRAELTQFGAAPGPISITTKRLYTKRLMQFKRNPLLVEHRARMAKKTAFSLELERTLRSLTVHTDTLATYAEHIPRMVASFEMQKTARQKMREGHLKKSFVYLLIDPRVSENLPGQAAHDDTRLATWKRFLQSIFYVGKGKNGRPYDHLYDALEGWQARPTDLNGSVENLSGMMAAVVPEKVSKLKSRSADSEVVSAHSAKIRRIHAIWSANLGVVCRPLFHNIIPTEAFTREAAMIDAIGLPNLTNVKGGEYYGAVRSWTMRERKQLGAALLDRAMQVLLADGESQLRPDDLL